MFFPLSFAFSLPDGCVIWAWLFVSNRIVRLFSACEVTNHPAEIPPSFRLCCPSSSSISPKKLAIKLPDMSCYYKDGRAAINGAYYPCRNGLVFNETSATAAFNATGLRTCCEPKGNDRCLPNGLCDIPGERGYLYRGACDNERGDGCRSICPEVNAYSWTEVKRCEPGVFCCGPDRNAERAGDCCSNIAARFLLPDLGAMPASASATSTNTASTTASTASSSSSSSSDTRQSSSPSAALIAGPVIGAVVALALLILAVFLLRRARRKRRSGRVGGLIMLVCNR
ncbi:hypothetical protein XA68_12342 [Ophiocordyceps unilateralis]|uniref:WSC domain-containing protein n=1 Tax=Ophiocordyceps unilateralis TaxID=268505 RepID=A0A2A9PQ80_OPHUN|nr:hypothetical protein XA68_12342 [Ophiocordyceps unilateralis]